MSANSFGQNFKILSFGESHGPAMGVVIEGCPAGMKFDAQLLQSELDRRRPGSSNLVSQRAETDQFEVLSGVYKNMTLGTPISIIVRNIDARSKDYENLQASSRTGHADQAWRDKFVHTDPRGGGRSSGRETLSRVIGGALAKMFVLTEHPEILLAGYAKQIGSVELTSSEINKIEASLSAQQIHVDAFAARFPLSEKSAQVESLLVAARESGESYGGTARIVVFGVPKGLGAPVFHKLRSDLAAAVTSVGAVNGVMFGDGSLASTLPGSEFHNSQNTYGGIQGGISNGEPIFLDVIFKPTSSILDVAKRGRHDPCIVPRAIPVLEAMVWLVLADHLLWQRLDRVERPASEV